MKIAYLSVAFLTLLQAFLGMTVSLLRRKYRISSGCPEDPAHPLFQVRTAFSNCAEWHPILIVLILLNGMNSGQKWIIWLYPAAVAARCFLVMGLVTAPIVKPNVWRLMGAGLTYLLTIVLSLTLVAEFLPGPS